MREKLKNELLLLLNTHVDDNNLKSVSQELDVILSNYEVETRKTDIVLYNFEKIRLAIPSAEANG